MKNLFFISILLIAITITGRSQTATSIVSFKNPASVAPPKGYSHAAIVDLGNSQMIVLSGQVPLDKQGNLVGKDDLTKQCEQVFMNIKNILTDVGGTMDNVIKIGIYMVDVSQIQTVRDVRNKYINLQNPPASTLVQVSSLFRGDVLIEIEATAIIPKE